MLSRGILLKIVVKKLLMILISMPSIDKVSKVTSPVLVIHGTEDEVIDFSHGIAIHDKCQKAVEPLWVEVTSLMWFFFNFEPTQCRALLFEI